MLWKKKALTGLKALFAKYKFNLKFLLIEHGGYACELWDHTTHLNLLPHYIS